MVRLLTALSLLASLLVVGDAGARVMTARVARVNTAVATMEDVQVRLQWADGAPHGQLQLRAAKVDAPELGYRFRDLDWRCPLLRDENGGWRCEGELRSGRAPPFRLALALGQATTDVALSRGGSRVTLQRNAASPDLTRIELAAVPLAWTQALLRRAWSAPNLNAGTLDARLDISAPSRGPMRITGPLTLRGGAFDTPDGSIAAENVGAALQLQASLGPNDAVALNGYLHGGEMLFGTTYVSMAQRDVAVQVRGEQHGNQGWRFPQLRWHDGGIFNVSGNVTLGADGNVRDALLRLDSADLSRLRDSYLSGWLGLAGLGDLALAGAADARVEVLGGRLRGALVRLHETTLDDPQGRFDFNGLEGDIAFSADDAVQSALRWRSGALYGLDFGAATLPFTSADGELAMPDAVTLPILGGQARFDGVRIRPPVEGRGLEASFGLALERVDIARLAKALDWPAFTGELSGRIPQARYANDRLDFDGGLDMQLFDGRVSVSSLSMERPFGVAPTLSADIVIDDLDLESLTGVFGFGSITGALDGRITGLRLVDWQPVAFDARLYTERKRGLRQRISQRAVQNISSVGDASFVTSLQGQLIGLFDDFGYKRIGIACRLADEVCAMDGLGSAGQGFIIVDGSGLPRLTVVGFNRRVDWPTLVERLAAIGKGEVKPVLD